MLTDKMRDVLIAHIDGPVPASAEDLYPKTTRRAALDREWIVVDATGLLDTDDPTAATAITDEGRRVLAVALADWADALQRARFAPNAPIERQEAAE
jgi:hypothetical protein